MNELTVEQRAENQRTRRREYQRAYAAKYPDRVRATQRKYRERNPEAYRDAVHRHRQKRRDAGLPCRSPEVRQRANKRLYAKTVAAVHSGKRWTDQEKRKLFDPALTDSDLCAVLGRSRQSIEVMRSKCRHMAPDGWVPKNTSKPQSVSENHDTP